MLIFGIHPVLEALRSDSSTVEKVIVTRGKGNPRLQEIIDLAREHRVALQFEPQEALTRKAGTPNHQSVVAEIASVQLSTIEQVLARKPRLLVLLDGVEDPHNLGAVIRTAEAAGVDAILLPQRHSCGITATVTKVSAGAAMHLPICRIGNVAQTLERLQQEGFWSVGLDMSGKEGLAEIDLSLPLVLVVGAENRGLRRLVREKCDFLLRLPMKGKVSSLNLSVAAGVLIYTISMKRNNLL